MASELTALYAAYSIVWLGTFTYLIYLHLRQRTISRDTKALKEELLRHGK